MLVSTDLEELTLVVVETDIGWILLNEKGNCVPTTRYDMLIVFPVFKDAMQAYTDHCEYMKLEYDLDINE